MSLEKDITGVKHNLDEDVFKSATDEDLENRKSEEQKEIERKEKEWEEKNGRKIDTCPHCGTDLRDEGVIRYETLYQASSMLYNYMHLDTGWECDYSEINDSDVTGYACGACERELIHGKDFEVEFGADL